MKYFTLCISKLTVPSVIMGCMRINNLSSQEIDTLVKTAMDNGVNFFDHADIYGGGTCDEKFGDALNMTDDFREKIIIQTKCGIRKGFYDFSKEHILDSVDNSLKHLKTDYIDVLLLHRPDMLCDPVEVAEALHYLKKSGKVNHFGVSNHTPLQIELLKSAIPFDLVANQMQFNVAHTPLIDSSITVNMLTDQAVNRDSGILDYCRLNKITIQAWSPFRAGVSKSPFIGDNENYPELNSALKVLADKYSVTPTAIATAWIARHPANIQIISGSTNPQRLCEVCKGAEIYLTREEWYELYCAAGNKVP